MQQINPINAKILHFIKLFKLFLPVILTQLFYQPTKSQTPIKLRSTLSACGASKSFSFSGKDYIIQESIGQPSIIGIAQVDKIFLRQGFIQPYKFQTNGNVIKNLPVKVSPNPFLSDITVTFSENITDNLFFSLYDSYGKLIYCNKSGAVQIIHLNLNDIAPGIYVLKASSGNTYYIAKLIKE